MRRASLRPYGTEDFCGPVPRISSAAADFIRGYSHVLPTGGHGGGADPLERRRDSWSPTLDAMKLRQGWGTRHPAIPLIAIVLR